MLEGYKAKCQKFYCDYTGTYNDICVANHIKHLFTKDLTFYSCYSFKRYMWDFQNIDNASEKIWDIASDRYRGW
jgi:hypothetical protein